MNSWRATQPSPEHRCLLRQSEVSYFQTGSLVNHNWDPRPDTIRYRLVPDLLCTRFYPRTFQIRVKEGPGSGKKAQEVAAGWPEP